MVEGLWEKANQVGEVGYRIDSLASVAALLGESMSDDTNSGVAWALYEMLKRYGDDLDKLSMELMALNAPKVEEPKKGKKK